jgi:hypothetical protein
MTVRGRYARLALLLLLACIGCHREAGVMVVEKTKIFHTRECARILMAHAVEMSVADALRLQYQPCPDCRPMAAK